MSECVVRMEMPSDCERCPMRGTASGGNGMYELWCMCGDIPASSQRRPEDCPIVCQLPEGHGRLIDAEKLKANKYHSDITHENAVAVAEIDWAETIVPAEAERSET